MVQNFFQTTSSLSYCHINALCTFTKQNPHNYANLNKIIKVLEILLFPSLLLSILVESHLMIYYIKINSFVKQEIEHKIHFKTN